jgi:hypothetical protein
MLALYLPKVFGGALVLLVGVLLAQLANGLVRGAAEGVGLDYASGWGESPRGWSSSVFRSRSASWRSRPTCSTM